MVLDPNWSLVPKDFRPDYAVIYKVTLGVGECATVEARLDAPHHDPDSDVFYYIERCGKDQRKFRVLRNGLPRQWDELIVEDPLMMRDGIVDETVYLECAMRYQNAVSAGLIKQKLIPCY